MTVPALAFAAVMAVLSVVAGTSAVQAQAVTTAPTEETRFTTGTVEILSPWSRATQPGQKIGAAYMVLRNPGKDPVSLVSATSPTAAKVVFHDTAVKDGFMQMIPHEGGFDIPPGGEIELKPGGSHLMLLGVTKMLKVGKVYPLTLAFSDGTSTTVDLIVWDVGLMRTVKKTP